MNITEDFNDFDWELWAETVDIDDEEILDEAVLSFSQRIKRARTMKRLAPRMKNLRRIKKFRMADKDILMKRARKRAIKMFRKKVAGEKGEHYSQLSPAAKISIDKLIQKKMPAVTKLAQRLLPKVRKAEVERLRSARKPTNEARQPQDPDIKDRAGTQPKKYFKDLSKSTKAARDAHFKKYAKKDDSDPSNYKPAPGDKSAETKPSVHTKKYKKMFGEAVTVGGKTYQDLELCGDAVKLFKRDIADDSLDKGKVEAAIRAVDNYLSIERKALKNKNATPADMDRFKKLQAVARQKISAAGLKGHNYHDLHLRTMKDLAKKLDESNGQTDDVADIVPDRIRISMISGSKKRMLNDKFEKMSEQDSAERTRERHAAERERLKTQHKREKEQQKATHDRQLDRSKIRDIRSESLNEAFEAMQRKQQKGSSSIVPRDDYMLDEKQIDALKKKAEKSGIPYGTLKKVYDRGMAAWKSGHRPGTTPQQWAFARVNSFVTKSKGTWGGADKDLASKVRKESLDESFQMQVQQPAGYGQMVTAKEAGIHIQAGFAFHPSVSEEGGAGEFGTDKLVKKYKEETPGEDLKEQSWIQFESCCEDCMEELMITEAEYQGKKVKLNDPIRTSENPKKKFKVYVRDPSSGNIKVVRFGDPGLSIKRDDPGRRRNFRARHNCDNPGPITKARYWSCRMWSKRTVSSLD